MNIHLDQLQQDHATITQILQARRAITMATLPISVRLSLNIYFMLLEDALSTLNQLIESLNENDLSSKEP